MIIGVCRCLSYISPCWLHTQLLGNFAVSSPTTKGASKQKMFWLQVGCADLNQIHPWVVPLNVKKVQWDCISVNSISRLSQDAAAIGKYIIKHYYLRGNDCHLSTHSYLSGAWRVTAVLEPICLISQWLAGCSGRKTWWINRAAGWINEPPRTAAASHQAPSQPSYSTINYHQETSMSELPHRCVNMLTCLNTLKYIPKWSDWALPLKLFPL